MSKLAIPPGNNPVIFLVLGVGAWWFLTQRRATAATPAGVRAPGLGQYFTTPSRAGDSLQKQAIQAGLNSNAVGGLIGSILNGKLFGGSGTLQPSGVTEAARAAVRAGDSYYSGSATPALTTGDFSRMDRASGFNTLDDGASIVTPAARAAVRFGDSYYGSNDTAVANPIGNAGESAVDYAYSNDAAALNPAPGSSYTTEVYEYTPAPELDASNFDYWG
jgi:hypothetical protein